MTTSLFCLYDALSFLYFVTPKNVNFQNFSQIKLNTGLGLDFGTLTSKFKNFTETVDKTSRFEKNAS